MNLRLEHDVEDMISNMQRDVLVKLVDLLSKYERKWIELEFNEFSQFREFGPPISGIRMSENAIIP